MTWCLLMMLIQVLHIDEKDKDTLAGHLGHKTNNSKCSLNSTHEKVKRIHTTILCEWRIFVRRSCRKESQKTMNWQKLERATMDGFILPIVNERSLRHIIGLRVRSCWTRDDYNFLMPWSMLISFGYLTDVINGISKISRRQLLLNLYTYARMNRARERK